MYLLLITWLVACRLRVRSLMINLSNKLRRLAEADNFYSSELAVLSFDLNGGRFNENSKEELKALNRKFELVEILKRVRNSIAALDMESRKLKEEKEKTPRGPASERINAHKGNGEAILRHSVALRTLELKIEGCRVDILKERRRLNELEAQKALLKNGTAEGEKNKKELENAMETMYALEREEKVFRK